MSLLLNIAGLPRSTYYYYTKKQKEPEKYVELKEEICSIAAENKGRYGYRRVTQELRNRGFHYNHKLVMKLMKQMGLSSKVRMKKYRSYKGEVGKIAPNLLERDFYAEKPNQKWVTDVTEFKYGNTLDSVHKVYLSAILDLCDRRPVAYVIGDSNNNALVFETFDKAVKANPGAHPIFHSDRGYQYTSRRFHQKLEEAGMVQSMSRVAHCTDNGVMEGFWGILKREMYYGKKFESREELEKAITEYIDYYTNDRPQRGLGVLTPMEFHEKQRLAA